MHSVVYFKVEVSEDGNAALVTLNGSGDEVSRRDLGKVHQLVMELEDDFRQQDLGGIHCDAQPALAIAARVAGVEITSLQTVAYDRDELAQMVGEIEWRKVLHVEDFLICRWEELFPSFEIGV